MLVAFKAKRHQRIELGSNTISFVQALAYFGQLEFFMDTEVFFAMMLRTAGRADEARPTQRIPRPDSE